MAHSIRSKGNFVDVDASILQIPQEKLALSASLISHDVIMGLGGGLEGQSPHARQEFGFSDAQPIAQQMIDWCKKQGSTVFVLLSTLEILGRRDWIFILLKDMEMYLMRLHVLVEGGPDHDPGGGTSFRQVTTNSQFTLQQALENTLGGELTHFQIVGPDTSVTWSTKVEALRGQQLTVRYHKNPDSQLVSQIYSSSLGGTQVKQVVGSTSFGNTQFQPMNEFEDDEITHQKRLAAVGDTLSQSPSLSDSNNVSNTNNASNNMADPALYDSVMGECPSSTYMIISTMENQNDSFTDESQTFLKKPPNEENVVKKEVYIPQHEDAISDMNPEGHLVVESIVGGHLSPNTQPDSNILLLSNTQPTQPGSNILFSNDGFQHLADNVPRFSRLESNSYSITGDAQWPSVSRSFPKSCSTYTKPNNLNDCPSSVMKNFSVHETKVFKEKVLISPVVSCNEAAPDATDLDVDGENSHTSMDTADSSFQPPLLNSSDGNLSSNFECGGPAASSLLLLGENTKDITVPMCASRDAYVSHDFILNIVDKNISSTNPLSVVSAPECGHCRLPQIPAQKREKAESLLEFKPSEVLRQQQKNKANLSPKQPLADPAHDIALLRHSPQPGHHKEVRSACDNNTIPQFLDVSIPGNCIEGTRSHHHNSMHQAYEQQQIHVERILSRPQTLQTKTQQVLAVSSFPKETTFQSHASNMDGMSPQHQTDPNPSSNEEQNSLHKSSQSSLMCHTPLSPDTSITEAPPNEVERNDQQSSHYSSGSSSKTSSDQVIYSNVISPDIVQRNHQIQSLRYNKLDPGPQPVNQIQSLRYNKLDPGLQPEEDQTDDYVPMYLTNSGLISPTQRQQIQQSNQQHIAVQQCRTQELTTALNTNYPHQTPRIGAPRDYRQRSMNLSTAIRHQSFTSPPSSSGSSSEGIRYISPLHVPISHPEGPRPFHSPPFRPNPPASRIAYPFQSDCVPQNNVPTGDAGVHPIQAYRGAASPHQQTWPDARKAAWTSPPPTRRVVIRSTNSDDHEHYSSIDPNQVSAATRPSFAENNLLGPANLQEELSGLHGWCPMENGDTIQATMESFRKKDGAYIIWQSRRHKNFIITVSHQNELFHLRIHQSPSSQGPVYCLWEEGGFRSTSLLTLVEHYREQGIPISTKAANGKVYREIIRLLIPLKVRVERVKRTVKKRDT